MQNTLVAKTFVYIVVAFSILGAANAYAASAPPAGLTEKWNQRWQQEYTDCIDRGWVSEAQCGVSANERVKEAQIGENFKAEVVKDCGSLDVGCVAGGVVSKMVSGFFSWENLFWWLSWVGLLVLGIGKMLLGWSIWWFDGAVYYLVLRMGDLVNNQGLNGIRIAWGLIRDLGNIAIIAGFVAVGISTILQVATYAADKFLTKLIIAALLINFSYFFAGAIIDATNFVAQQIFYSEIMQQGCTTLSHAKGIRYLSAPLALAGDGLTYATGMSGLSKMYGGDSALCSIGSSFAGHLRLTTFDSIDAIATAYGGTDDGSSDKQLGGSGKGDYNFAYFALTFFGGLFLIAVSIVFLMSFGLLVSRFVALILLLITSPIGIAGVNIPYINKFATRWWDALISQAVFAPVYFLLVAFSLVIMKGLGEILKTGGETYAKALSASPSYVEGAIPLILTYFIGIGFMVAALRIAQQMSSASPDLKALTDWVSSNASGFATARTRQIFMQAPAWVARQGVDAAAASRERGWLREGLIGLSGGLRSFGEVGSGKKREKSAFEESREAINALAVERYGEEDRKALLGGKYLGLTLNTGLLRSGDLDSLTPELRAKAKSMLKGKKVGELIEEFGSARLEQFEKSGLLSDTHLEEIAESGALSKEQKSAIYRAHFAEFMGAVKGGDADEVNKRLDQMTELERKLLFVENKELRANQAFLKLLEGKNFEKVTSDKDSFSREQADAAKEIRLKGVLDKDTGKHVGGFEEDLASDDARVRETALNRMTPKEKRKVSYETFKKLAEKSSLRKSEIRDRYRHVRGEEQKRMEEDFPWLAADTGVGGEDNE